MPESSEKKTPRDLLRAVFRRWGLFLVGSALFAMAALIVSHYWPALKYTGIAKFVRRTEKTVDRAGESFEQYKLRLHHDLVGRGAVERVTEELGMTRGLARDKEGRLTQEGEFRKRELVRGLMDKIAVKWEVRSEDVDLVALSITHDDPKLAMDIPNRLVKNYIERTSKEILDTLGQRKDYLRQRVDDNRKRLEELKTERTRFEAKYAGMMPESAGALQERINQTRADLDSVRRLQQMAKQKLARLTGPGTPTTGPASQPAEPMQIVRGPNPEVKRLEEQLQDVKTRLDNARTVGRMKDSHPTVQSLLQQADNLEKRLKETPPEVEIQRVYGTDTSLVQAVVAARSDLEMTTAEIDRLETRLKALDALMANFVPVRQGYLELVDRIAEQQAELDRWQQRLIAVDEALQTEAAKLRTHLDAVERAQEQMRPSSPSIWMVLAFALIGGMGFGGGLVFLAGTMDRTVLTTEDAMAHFDAPVLGVISEINSRGQRRGKALRRWLLGPIFALMILAGLGLCGLSATLRLMAPREYSQWTASPVQFLRQHAQDLARRTLGGLENR